MIPISSPEFSERIEQSAFGNEPETDFARAESREAMREALATVRARLSERVPLVIGGKRREGAETLVRPNPARVSEVVAHVALASASQAVEAVTAAARAFPAWRDTPAEERARVLFRAAGAARRRRFELAAWEVYEVGKPWREADADVAEAIDFLEFYGREMLRLAVPRRRDVPGERNEYFYEPRGVAAVIAPWNFPLAILTGMTAAALVTGNTVVMKPAEQSSVIGLRLMELFEEAGLPAGVLNLLPGRGEEVGPPLVTHPEVALIAFTGSKAVGLAINIQAAQASAEPGSREIKRVLAELGGKNAILIDDDADLDEAVPGVLASGFGYQGQKCSAASRVIVHEAVYEAFTKRLAEAALSLRVGAPEDPGATIGPVVDAEARDRIRRYLEIGRRDGRVLAALDISALEEAGYFVPPTLFADVPVSSPLWQEEVFGPVMAMLPARSFEAALEMANDSLYALTGGLYSRSPAHILQARREFRVGNLYINRKITGAMVDRQPFGGFRMSGIGSKAGGPDYLLQFVIPRTITESTLRRGFAADEAG
jgi:RHH-type transcriptional regulator, proline utilization regulon repressor / proline dehydrogenase / delta 1-pyrroline-5-carboxylate dehydrogenase